MQFLYENQDSNSFLVYKLSNDDKLDSFNYGMLANNKISNIIPALFSQVNSDEYLKYNISAKVTLKQYFEGVVNKKQIVNVFLSITKAIIDAEEYMIDTSMFVLDPDYIYVDVSTAEASIICFPIVGFSSGMKIYDFFKNLMFTTSFDQTENTDYVARIISFLNSNNNFSILDYKKVLLSIDSITTNQQQVQSKDQVQVNPVVNKPQPTAPPVQPKPAQVTPTPQPQQQTANPVVSNSNTIQGVYYYSSEKSTAPVEPKNAPNRQAVDNAGTKMSLMHLLTNFSKENLEIYKSQSNGKSVSVDSNVAQNANKKDKKSKKAKPQSGNPIAGFSIPGMDNNPQIKDPIQPQTVNDISNPKNENISTQKNYTVQQTITTDQQIPSVQQPQIIQPVQPGQQTQVMQPAQGVVSPYQQSANNSGFGGTTVLGVNKGTTVLGGGAVGQPAAKNPRLIRSKNNETILINKPVFRIGKEKSYVDYFVSDNSAVSRGHANILIHEDNYYIIDTNSTNHTYINGAMIPSNTETPLNDKDMIKLGNEDFEFRIY